MTFTKGNVHEYGISKDGTVINLKAGNFQTALSPSDDEKVFPTREGWLKINKAGREQAWEYVRLKKDGTLENHHFCTDHTACSSKYKGLEHYFDAGVGRKG